MIFTNVRQQWSLLAGQLLPAPASLVQGFSSGRDSPPLLPFLWRYYGFR